MNKVIVASNNLDLIPTKSDVREFFNVQKIFTLKVCVAIGVAGPNAVRVDMLPQPWIWQDLLD